MMLLDILISDCSLLKILTFRHIKGSLLFKQNLFTWIFFQNKLGTFEKGTIGSAVKTLMMMLLVLSTVVFN